MQIGGQGAQTVDGVVVRGRQIYVVGTHAGGGMLCFGSSAKDCSVHEEEGMYVAEFEIGDSSTLTVGMTRFFTGENITPAGIGVLESGDLVVGGFRSGQGAISNTEPPVSGIGAFVLQFSTTGEEDAASTIWTIGSSGAMLGFDAQVDTWCAVGRSNSGASQPGFLTCRVGDGDLMEHELCGRAAEDLDMGSGDWQMAWSLCDLPATAVKFTSEGVDGVGYRTDTQSGTTGELVATNGNDVVLLARESNQSVRVLASIQQDALGPGMPDMTNTNTSWTVPLGGTVRVAANDMIVSDELEVHLVGQLQGSGTGALVGTDGESGLAYYAVIANGIAHVVFAGTAGSDFRAIAATNDGAIVIGGQGRADLDFPDIMLDADNLDGFVMVLPGPAAI